MSTGIPRRRRFPLRRPDRSRLVRANFTGRAVQELPGLACAFGPLNMWVGPFHEFVIEQAPEAIRGDQEHQ